MQYVLDLVEIKLVFWLLLTRCFFRFRSRSVHHLLPLARNLIVLRGIMARKLALGVFFMALLAVSLAARPASEEEAGVAMAGDAASR
jgi:hypothetical protein